MTFLCDKHSWNTIYETPRGSSKREHIQWCQNCGCVKTDTAYFDPTPDHFSRLFTPTCLEKK